MGYGLQGKAPGWQRLPGAFLCDNFEGGYFSKPSEVFIEGVDLAVIL
jgi:hypothetical protein